MKKNILRILTFFFRKLKIGEIVLNLINEKKLNEYYKDSISTKAIFHPEAKVFNFQYIPSKIICGENSHIRGELLVFAYGGLISIGNYCYIGEGSKIWSGESIEIGNNVLISHNVNIIDTNSHEFDEIERHETYKKIIFESHPSKKGSIITKKIVIKDNAWINFNVIILKGVTIGNGAVVAAGSVVTKDIPNYAMVAGNPARIIRYINSDQHGKI